MKVNSISINNYYGLKRQKVKKQHSKSDFTEAFLQTTTGRISIRPNHLGALDISDTLRERIDSDVEVLLRNSEHCADRIVEVYSDFIEQFSQKYAPKVGTGECIITSEQFNKELEAWKKDLGDEKLKELDELEREILEVIQKTKQGKLAKE